MPVADRRAPRGVRRFAVLKTFRYMRRVYEAGGVFVPRGDVPRHRLDRLWRDGSIGTLEGDRCTAEKNRPEEAAEELVSSPHDPSIEEELPEYGEDHLD